MIIWVVKIFFVQFFCVFCHLFLASSVSVTSIHCLSFIEPIFAWNVALVSLIFLKRSLVFPICCFPLFLCIDHWCRLSYLSLLFFGTLHSDAYIFPFLHCHVGSPKMGGSWWRGLTKCGPLEKGMANHFSIFALRTPWTVQKGEKVWHWKINSPGQYVPNRLLEKSGEVTPERMKGWSQSKNNTQLWMWLVTEARSDAVKSNIA